MPVLLKAWVANMLCAPVIPRLHSACYALTVNVVSHFMLESVDKFSHWLNAFNTSLISTTLSLATTETKLEMNCLLHKATQLNHQCTMIMN